MESFNKYKKKLENFLNSYDDSVKRRRLDTVGAVCIDSKGNLASAVSSGGIVLKIPGRLGQVLSFMFWILFYFYFYKAAIYGSGAWAQRNVAVTTSGVGEYLIKTSFAKKCSSKLLKCHDLNYVKALSDTFQNNFLGNLFILIEIFLSNVFIVDSSFLIDVEVDNKLAGVLALVHNQNEQHLELLWGHTTQSMCIGYMNSSHKNAKSFISELPNDSNPGQISLVEAKSFR